MSIILKALKKTENESGKENKVDQNLAQGFFLSKNSGSSSGFFTAVLAKLNRKYLGLGLILIVVLGFSLILWHIFKSSAPKSVAPPIAVEDDFSQEIAEKNSQVKPMAKTSIVGGSIIQQAKKAFEVGNLDRSADLYRQAIQKNPNDALLHNSLGLVYQEKGLYSNASTEFQKALELDDMCAPCFNNFGLLKSSLGQALEAQKYFEQAININAAYPDPYFNLAVMHERAGDIGNAVKYYRQFINLYPDQQSDIVFKVNRRINVLTGK